MANNQVLLGTTLQKIVAHNQTSQWETFITEMLVKLELSEAEKLDAKMTYEALGRHLIRTLGLEDNDVHVVVQGSMKTQTTISPRGNQNFDLDIVVKLSGSKFEALENSQQFFNEFGAALEGIPDSGKPEAKKRCWRLRYPGKPFYFDVTPAIPHSGNITHTDLRVRDPKTVWSPSNPEEFADWFCEIANKRFNFQLQKRVVALDSVRHVDPLPIEQVRLDDILRRTVQLIKLHRDNYYIGVPTVRRDAKPISIILVTLAAQAYDELVETSSSKFSSAIAVVLRLVEILPSFIDRTDGAIKVLNPELSFENFAELWNEDGGLRDNEFSTWHKQLTEDLELLLSEDYARRSEPKIQKIFGSDGLNAWKASHAKPSNIFQGLLATVPAEPRRNPSSPNQAGSNHTLA